MKKHRRIQRYSTLFHTNKPLAELYLQLHKGNNHTYVGSKAELFLMELL